MSLLFKSSLIVLSSLCILTACSEELKKKEELNDPRIVQLQASQVAVHVKGLNRPNSYDIELEWPEAKGQVRVSSSSKTLALISGNDRRYVDPEVSGGSEVSYLIEHLSGDGRITASIPVFVRVPKDVLWDSEFELKDHLKVSGERLFITGHAKIFINDKNLAISVKEIISDGGVIQNFKDDSRAAIEKSGRSGGSITIVAEKASGSLQVNLTGEDGGNGKQGAITVPGRHPGCAGTSGGDGGNAGNLNVNIVDGTTLNISVWNKEGKPGIAGKKGSVNEGPSSEVVYPPCDRYTPNGIDGQPGGKGQVCLKLAEALEYVCQ